jgi:hypothetical protein
MPEVIGRDVLGFRFDDDRAPLVLVPAGAQTCAEQASSEQN